MKAQVNVDLLRSLHRILRQRTDLQDRLQQGPRRVKIAEAAEQEFRRRRDESRDLLTQTKKHATQKQRQLDEREARIEEFKKKLNSCESNREYQLLNDQVAADKQANSVLSDEILEQLLRIDEIESKLKEAESNLEKVRTETASVHEKVQGELAIVQGDLEIVERELLEAESKLPSDVVSEYRRMKQSIGENALAPVEENTCGNCCTVLTSQVISELRMSKTVFCKSCGSLLYFSENATV